MSDILPEYESVTEGTDKGKTNNDSHYVSLDTEVEEEDKDPKTKNKNECGENTDTVKNLIETVIGNQVPDNVHSELSWIYMQNQKAMYETIFWVQYNDDSSPLDYTGGDRNRFVLLVFSIVLAMLIVTAALNMVVLLTPDLRDFFRSVGFVIIIAPLIIMVGLGYAVACLDCIRRPPMNILLLVIAVICMSIISAYFTSRHKTSSIVYAIIATIVVVIVCMGLACSSFDFTKYLLFAVVITTALGALFLTIVLGMLISKASMPKPLHMALLVILTVSNVVILTMELQMILGGRTVELSEDDYAIGAYYLYTSIVDIFIKMVQMIGMYG